MKKASCITAFVEETTDLNKFTAKDFPVGDAVVYVYIDRGNGRFIKEKSLELKLIEFIE